MTSRAYGLSGFNSFRTGHQTPMAEEFRKPIRVCKVPGCTTVLSRFNASDTCCKHLGSFDIPDWAEALAEDKNIDELEALAKALAPIKDMRSKCMREQVSARNDEIRAHYREGWSQYKIVKHYHLSRRNVQEIVKYAKGGSK